MALPNNPTQLEVVKAIKDLEGGAIIELEENGSTTAGTWLAKTDKITALQDGQLFLYKIAVAGATTTTLNITANGTALGAITIYRVGTTKLTTQYGVGQYLLLIYNTTNSCFRVVNDYDANSYAYVRQYQAGSNAAGSGTKYPVLTRYNLTNKNGTYDTAYSRFHTGVTIDTSNGNLDAPTISENGTALSNKYLPNFSLSISHQTAGNPRQVKFLTVDYNTAATYFKMSATSCHDNGTSYQFLEDIIIGCTTSGTVVCNVYKYCQQTVTLDNVARNYGDVFYVIDSTNKKVDFFILCGQCASSQFTPATKIGNTTIAYITQYTGTATYYSSGTKVWADGDSALYVRTGDLKTVNGNSLIGSGDITITAPTPTNMVTTDTNQTISGVKTFTGGISVSGRSVGGGDDEGIVVGRASNNYAGVCLGSPSGMRSVFYLTSANQPVWRWNNGTTSYDIVHPNIAGTIAIMDASTQTGSFYATSFYASSDERLKENIKPTELDCGKVIDSLQIKEFNFKSDEEKKVVVGAIAQELKEILPEKYRAELVSGSEDTHYSINEGKLLFIAIGALKEERAKTKELEERLAKIEAKLGV